MCQVHACKKLYIIKPLLLKYLIYLLIILILAAGQVNETLVVETCSQVEAGHIQSQNRRVDNNKELSHRELDITTSLLKYFKSMS